MKTYVIPDIHGRYDLLSAALVEIEERDDTGTVVFLGDYVDRGWESRQVIKRLMTGPSDGWNWYPIRGNHEDMLLECNDPTHPEHEWWLSHGGSATLSSYWGNIKTSHINWMKQLPRLHYDKHRVYVHAGVDEGYPLDEQPERVTQWFRYPSKLDIGHGDRHVVHGHTPIGPELYKNRTNLDNGAVFTDHITVGVFDDDIAGGPIEVMYVRLKEDQ